MKTKPFFPKLSILIIAVVSFLLFPRAESAPSRAAAATTDYDAVSDFSITSNPNGVWSYGWESVIGSQLNLFAVTDTASVSGMSAWLASGTYPADPPFLAHNDTSSTICSGSFCVPVTVLHLHPGPENQITVVRWTAPNSGNYFLQGAMMGLDIVPATTSLSVLLDNTRLFRTGIDSSHRQRSFHRVIAVAAGDTLDFALDFGQNRNYFNDSTGIPFQLTQE